MILTQTSLFPVPRGSCKDASCKTYKGPNSSVPTCTALIGSLTSGRCGGSEGENLGRVGLVRALLRLGDAGVLNPFALNPPAIATLVLLIVARFHLGRVPLVLFKDAFDSVLIVFRLDLLVVEAGIFSWVPDPTIVLLAQILRFWLRLGAPIPFFILVLARLQVMEPLALVPATLLYLIVAFLLFC